MWLIFNNQTQFDTWHNEQMTLHPPTDSITQAFAVAIPLQSGKILTNVDDDFILSDESVIEQEEKELLLPSPKLNFN